MTYHYKYKDIKYASPRLKAWHVTRVTVTACPRVPVLKIWCADTNPHGEWDIML